MGFFGSSTDWVIKIYFLQLNNFSQETKNSQKISVTRSSSSNKYISRTLNWIESQRNCFKKYSNLDSLWCFLISQLHCIFLSDCCISLLYINVLKQVKNYHHSTMGQKHLNGLAMLNINCDIAWQLWHSINSTFSQQISAKKAFVK